MSSAERFCNSHALLAAIFAIVQASFGQSTPQSLEIANPEAVGSGARARALGNAFVALADDATAANWNPGGLSQLTRPEFSFAINGFSRSTNTHADIPSENDVDLAEFNYASIVLPFQLFDRNAVFSLSYLNQYRFDQEVDLPFDLHDTDGDPAIVFTETDFSGRYRIDADGNLSSITPALGIDVTDKFALGLALNIWNNDLTNNSTFQRRAKAIDRTVTTTVTVFGTPSGPTTTALSDSTRMDTYEVDRGYSFTIGGLYRLNRQISIGAVLKPAFTLDLDRHKQTFGFSTDVDERHASELDMPWEATIACAYRPTDQLSFATDLTWTEWSQYRFRTEGQDLNPIDGSNGDRPADILAARVGAEYVFIRDEFLVPLRCGVGYVPVPSASGSDVYYTVSLGGGIQLGDRWNLDLAYEYRWGDKLNEAAVENFSDDVKAHQDSERHSIMASLILYF